MFALRIPRRIFSRKAAGKSLVVVLIDMQTFFLEDYPIANCAILVEQQRKVLAICAEHDIPVVVLEYERRGPTLSELQEVLCAVPRVTFLTKNRNDGFAGSTLNEHLRAYSAGSLVLMGVSASYCVQATAKSAIRLGFEVMTSQHVTRNANWRRRSEARDTYAWFGQNGCFFTDLSGLMEAMRARVTAGS